MAGLCRLLLLSLQKLPCVWSWSILLALQEGKIIRPLPMFLHVVFVLSFFNGEVDSNILFTETKAYKVKFNT